jgi:hypothetical protein
MWRMVLVLATSCFLMFSAGVLPTSAQQPTQQRMQTQEQEQIYGSQLMTEQERAEYRARMRAAATREEQENIRMEHHQQMRERAARQGITLPEEPPVKGGGMMRRDDSRGAEHGNSGPARGGGRGR